MEFSDDLIPLSDRDLDPEYRKYRLFAYLQRVAERFEEKRLYPHLSELKRYYTELLSFKGKKEELSDSFPKELRGMDLEEQRLFYQSQVSDEAFMEVLNELLELALPRLRERLEEGEWIRTSVMEHIQVKPVGLLPLRKREGFLLLSRADEWRAYRYRLNMVRDPSADRSYRDLRTRYLASFQKVNGPQKLKERLMRQESELPNPAVYWIESEWLLPRVETLLPIAKQVLIRSIEGDGFRPQEAA